MAEFDGSNREKAVEEAGVVEIDERKQQNVSYILERHGTLQLDPMPANDPRDPLNWPSWKKDFHVLLVGTQNMAATFMAAGIIPGYQAIAKDFGHPVPDISYFTSTQILIFGWAPILLLPFMRMYGRRPFLMVSALLTSVVNIGSGFCDSYGTLMATRVIAAFLASPVMAVGSAVVSDTCFSNQRGSRNGWWAVLATVGAPTGPFLMGFVEYHIGYRWIYWVFAIMYFILFCCWVFADETLYFRGGEEHKNGDRIWLGLVTKSKGVTVSLQDFTAPFSQFCSYRVFIPTAAYALTFCYTNVLMTVEVPEVFGAKFDLNSQQIGLQFLSIIIGTGIGEVFAGPLSDWWMKLRTRQRGGDKVIEDRLWIAYNGFVLAMIGIIVWGAMLDKAVTWNVVPLVGAAIANAGTQMVTTACITYAIDVDYLQSLAIGQFINCIRQTWGFIGPFYFPPMFDSLGITGACGLLLGLIGVVGMGPTMAVHAVASYRRPTTDTV